MRYENLDKLRDLRNLVIRHGLSNGAEIDAAEQEIMRLRAVNEDLRGALGITLQYGLPPHDISGKDAWTQARAVLQRNS